MTLVRRKSDGLYIASLYGWDGPDGRPTAFDLSRRPKTTTKVKIHGRRKPKNPSCWRFDISTTKGFDNHDAITPRRRGHYTHRGVKK